MNPIIIGCPKKNDDETFLAMYNSLIASTTYYDKIVVIDGGTYENRDYMNYLVATNPKLIILYLQTKTPLEAYNKLFEIAKEHKADLLLTQTDVVFPKLYKQDWLHMMQFYSQLEKVGAVTTSNGYGISGPDYLDGLKWLGGWCTYLPYKTIEKLGGYDTNFPNGYGVDIDYSYRLMKEDLDVFIINYWVNHHCLNDREHDNNPDTELHKQESAKYFRQKYKLGEFA